MPAFYNDKAFIKILREMGVAEEDLDLTGCPDGCIEASIPGKGFRSKRTLAQY